MKATDRKLVFVPIKTESAKFGLFLVGADKFDAERKNA